MRESSQSGKHVTCLGMGLMGTFSGPKSLAVQKNFNALWAGLTNPRDISDSFNENPLNLWSITKFQSLQLPQPVVRLAKLSKSHLLMY